MPNRCKTPSEKRDKGLMLSLNQGEYDFIVKTSRFLGMSKVDTVLNALKKTYNKKAFDKDFTTQYLIMLKRQIDSYKERIKKEQEELSQLEEEYDYMMNVTGAENETDEDI